MTTDTTDDNFDITDLANTQFSTPAVEPFCPQAVSSLPPLEDVHVPVYEHIRQEQVVAGMATQHRVENPAVQEQVIIQVIPQVSTEERIQEQIVASAPQVVGSLPPFEEFDAPVYNPIHHEHIVSWETTPNTFENPAVQEHVQIVERIQEQIVEPTDVLAPAVTCAAPSQQLPSIIQN